MEKFFDYPTEISSEILSKVTDVEDIVPLSLINHQIRNYLRISIKELITKEELVYLDEAWLIDYPALTSVDDRIIFVLKGSITIPRNLKKLNIKIENYENKYQIIEELLSQIDLTYTVRIIYPTRSFYRNIMDHSALIIDRGYYTVIHNYLRRGSLPDDIDNENEIDFDNENEIDFDDQDEIDFDDQDEIDFDDQDEINFDNEDEIDFDAIIISGLKKIYLDDNKNQDFVIDTYYPNSRFRNFLTDLSNKLEIDLFQLLPGYSLTGYVLNANDEDNTVNTLLLIYIIKFGLIISRITTGLALKLDDLLIKYANDLELISHENSLFWKAIIGTPFSINRNNTNYRRDAIIAHIYLTQPTIHQLINKDLQNIEKIISS